MKVKDLEKNTLIKEIADAIIADETFKQRCSSNIKRIFEDGKVDLHDITLIINLTVTVYNNYSKIRVSKKNMKPVFMLLITRLLIELKGDGALDEELILLMLEKLKFRKKDKKLKNKRYMILKTSHFLIQKMKLLLEI